MLKQNKNIPSMLLIKNVRNLCEKSGEIRNEINRPFYGEINIVIQAGKPVYIKRSETIK